MNSDDSFFKYSARLLDRLSSQAQVHSGNTVKAYRDTINLFRHFLLERKAMPFALIRFDLINHEVVYEFLAWLQEARGCHAATKNHRLAALKSFLNYCAIEDPALVAIYMDIQKVRSQRLPRQTAQLRKRCRMFCGTAFGSRPRVNRVAGDIG